MEKGVRTPRDAWYRIRSYVVRRRRRRDVAREWTSDVTQTVTSISLRHMHAGMHTRMRGEGRPQGRAWDLMG